MVCLDTERMNTFVSRHVWPIIGTGDAVEQVHYYEPGVEALWPACAAISSLVSFV